MTPIANQVPATESPQTMVQPQAVRFHRIPEITVCHLSPIESRRDERAFSRQSMPLVAYGVHPTILGPHSERGQVQGVEFVPLAKSRSRALRILSASRIVLSALEQKADLYHVHSPELIPAALLLKFVFGKQVVYDSREDFPSMMLTKAYLPVRLRTLASRVVAIAERLAARSLDGFITADSGTLRAHAKAGKSRKLVLYNFPNLQYFPEPTPANQAFDLVYRGGLSERAGTFVLLNSLRLLKDRGIPVRLLMFGYTDNQQTERAIRDALGTLGIEELVTLRGVIRHEDMAATLRQARIAVCPLQKIPKFLNNIPVKVFESWACGLPVIASDLPPIRPFFGKQPYGVLVQPGDSEELANAIAQMLSSPRLLEEYGRQARHAVLERYNMAFEIRKLLALYKEVLSC